jgi:2-polyprenyl-6-methoxyphenol hydroxylase-like FAD-dependent oxidoreductase
LRSALIVGAGIGGLAAGVALQRAGWRVRIHERAASPRELGFALLLAPNAMAALDELGVAAPIRAAGIAGTRFAICDEDGRVMRTFGAPPGGRLVLALRPVIHGALLDAAGAANLVLSSDVAEAAATGDRARVRLTGGGSDEADVVIGADGVGSIVRRQLHPAEPPPSPSAFVAVRGVARGVAHQLGELAGIAYLGDGVEAAVARASEDAVYWYMSLLAADFSGEMQDPRAIAEQRTERFDPRFRAIVEATEEADMRFDRLMQRAPLERWGSGRITLLGDAAHPMLPHTGQGAAQAIEDAVALGLALRDAPDADRALREYERVRSLRTRRVVAMGPRIAYTSTTRNPVRKTLRSAVIRYAPEWLLATAASSLSRDPHRPLRRHGERL